MANLGITVKELAVECMKQIEKGNGDKHILISDDDELNGLHTLFYGFTDENISEFKELFHDRNDENTVIILG